MRGKSVFATLHFVTVRLLCSCNETADYGTRLLEAIEGLASDTHADTHAQFKQPRSHSHICTTGHPKASALPNLMKACKSICGAIKRKGGVILQDCSHRV